jgi:hypothetical protein
MLKKVAFVLALAVLVSGALALESGPSNTVGFTKKAFDPGYTDFGLSFKFWDVNGGVPSYGTVSTRPSDIIGFQLTGGLPFLADEVIRQDNGENAFIAPGDVWSGVLETNANMLPGYAYWINNKQAASFDMVLAGEVDTSTFAIAIAPGESYTPVSCRDARVVSVGNAYLVGSGFTGGTLPFLSDEVIEQSSGAVAWYHTVNGWITTGLAAFTPMESYWIHSRAGSGGYTWNYGPGAIAPPPDRPGNEDNSINRITRPTRRSRAIR